MCARTETPIMSAASCSRAYLNSMWSSRPHGAPAEMAHRCSSNAYVAVDLGSLVTSAARMPSRGLRLYAGHQPGQMPVICQGTNLIEGCLSRVLPGHTQLKSAVTSGLHELHTGTLTIVVCDSSWIVLACVHDAYALGFSLINRMASPRPRPVKTLLLHL